MAEKTAISWCDSTFKRYGKVKWMIGLLVVSNVVWWRMWKREQESANTWAGIAIRMAVRGWGKHGR